ncbi:unnamed protein product [Trichobilharzia regenti]|nr:unnamed protein product [Trichobilharzia regenti]
MSSLLTHTTKALATSPLLSKQYYSYSQQKSRMFKNHFMNHSSRGFYNGLRHSNHEVHYLSKKCMSLSSSLSQLKFMPISLHTTPLPVTSLTEMNSKDHKNVIILNEHLKNALSMKIPSSSSLKRKKTPGVQATLHPDIFKFTSQSHNYKEFSLNTLVKFMKSFLLRRCISTYSKRVDTFKPAQLYRSCSENRRIGNVGSYKHKKLQKTSSEIQLHKIIKSTEVLEEDVDKSSEFGSHDTTEESSSFVVSSSMISNRELLPEHLSQYSELIITSPDLYEKYELNEEKLPETVETASHLVYEIGLTLMVSNLRYSLVNMKCLIYSINKWDKLHLNYGAILTENLFNDSSIYRIPPSNNFQLKSLSSPSKDTYKITNTCLFTVQGFNKRKNFYRLSTYAVVEKRLCQITPLDTSSSRSSATTTTTATTVSTRSSKRSLTKLSPMSGDNSSTTTKINNRYGLKSISSQKKYQGVNTAHNTVSSVSTGDTNEFKSNRRITSTKDKQIKMDKDQEETKTTTKKKKKTEGFRYCPQKPLMKHSHLFLEKSVEKSRVGIRRTFTPMKPRQRYQQQQQQPEQQRQLASKSSRTNHIKMLKRHSSVQSLQKTKYANIYSPNSKLYQVSRPRPCSVPMTNQSKDLKSSNVKRHHSQSLDKVNTIKQNKLSRNKVQPFSKLNKPLRQNQSINRQINIIMTNSGKTIQISNIQLIKLQKTQNRIQAGNSRGHLTKNNLIASINANITPKLDIFMPTDKQKSLKPSNYLIKRQLYRKSSITTPYPLNRRDKMKNFSVLQFVLGRITTNSRLHSVALKREIDKMKRIQFRDDGRIDDSTPEDTDTSQPTLASNSDVSTKHNTPMTGISKHLGDSVSRVIENKIRLHSDKPIITSETCMSVKIGTTGEESEVGGEEEEGMLKCCSKEVCSTSIA